MIDSNEPKLYTIDDIQRIFKIGRTKAYQLMNSDGFPSFRLNKKLYISEQNLNEWVSKTCRKTYKY